MGFSRKVLAPTNIVYGYHAVSRITHDFDDERTVVCVGSAQSEAAYENPDADKHWTNLNMGLRVGMTEEEAYEAVKADPLFEEYDETTNADVVEELADMLTDEQAANMPQVYPEWKPDTFYEAGKRLQYGGGLYRVLQSHTSQATWTPTAAPSLYAEILPGQGGDEPSGTYPEWVQPDSTNPFMRGDKVTHNGKVWESLVDNNVWEPGAVGTESVWHEIG